MNKDFIDSLPVELLRDIFLRTLLSGPEANDDTSKTPVMSLRNKTTPFLLSQVNRHWRTVVHDTSILWQSIALVHPNKNHIPRTSLWMEHLRNRPLDVLILQSDNPTEEEHEATAELLELLSSRIQNWYNIEFHFRGKIPEKLADHLRHLQRHRRPILRDANMSFKSLLDDRDANLSWEFYSIYTVWQSLQSIPTIRKIHWKAPFTPEARFSTQLLCLELLSPSVLTISPTTSFAAATSFISH
ncbi:hypothetical protein BDZ97DRAFT_259569 [Flammula alnicola]|nr:hypothetical protein BDZ97DRAFT_259569 [Flammula alnicola]